MNVLLAVRHDHCGLCGERRPLFIIELTAGQGARVVKKPAQTHAGICRPCLREIAAILSEDEP